MDRLICLCSGVKENTITETILNSDNANLKYIQDTTGAACNCGRCINAIESMLKSHSCREEKKRNNLIT